MKSTNNQLFKPNFQIKALKILAPTAINVPTNLTKLEKFEVLGVSISFLISSSDNRSNSNERERVKSKFFMHCFWSLYIVSCITFDSDSLFIDNSSSSLTVNLIVPIDLILNGLREGNGYL
ncbi:hypothetical protein BLOT_003053 [Blomia tropicalis]|nr:hypothetical protein BLOT_003053 [Blomia tropicalis]